MDEEEKAPATVLSEEQRRWIERNRRAALERKRRLQEAAARDSVARTRAAAAAAVAAVPPPKPAEERSGKQKLVAELLCRWWYALPPWPPEDFDYDAALEERVLRRVAVEEFHLEPELDECGRLKVYELAAFPGVFRDGQGRLLDLRPVEGRPSYDQLMLKSKAELHKLIVDAYDTQLRELEAQPCTGITVEEHRRELRKQASAARRRASFVLRFMPKAAKGA